MGPPTITHKKCFSVLKHFLCFKVSRQLSLCWRRSYESEHSLSLGHIGKISALDTACLIAALCLPYTRLEELGIEYHYIALFLQDTITKENMLAQIETKSRQYAKRQMTWLKRDKTVQWVRLNELESVKTRVSTFIKE